MSALLIVRPAGRSTAAMGTETRATPARDVGPPEFLAELDGGHDVLGRLPYKGGVMPSTYSGGILRFGVAKARRLWSRRTRGPTKATQPFVFGDWYRQLLLDEMREGGACVAGLFEVDQAVERLASVPFRGAEGWLHRYSDIMMFGWLCRGIR